MSHAADVEHHSKFLSPKPLVTVAVIVVLAALVALARWNTITIVNISGARISNVTVRTDDRVLFNNSMMPGGRTTRHFFISDDSDYTLEITRSDGRRFDARFGYLSRYLPTHATLNIHNEYVVFNKHTIDLVAR